MAYSPATAVRRSGSGSSRAATAATKRSKPAGLLVIEPARRTVAEDVGMRDAARSDEEVARTAGHAAAGQVERDFPLDHVEALVLAVVDVQWWHVGGGHVNHVDEAEAALGLRSVNEDPGAAAETGRPVRPTPVGEVVLRHADALLDQASAIEHEIAALTSGESGIVRVGRFFSAWTTFMPDVVAEVSRSRPGVASSCSRSSPSRRCAR